MTTPSRVISVPGGKEGVAALVAMSNSRDASFNLQQPNY